MNRTKLSSVPPQFYKRLKNAFLAMKKLWLALTKINSPPHVSVPEEKQKTPDEISTELIYKISGLEAKLYKIIIIKKKKLKVKFKGLRLVAPQWSSSILPPAIQSSSFMSPVTPAFAFRSTLSQPQSSTNNAFQ